MLEYLLDKDKWNEYLNYKLNSEFTNKRDKEALFNYVENEKYKDIATKIVNNEYTFSTPVKHEISKHDNNKKRIVYNFNNDEMDILKYILFLLYKYDNIFSSNLYSFRKSVGVKVAINSLKHVKNLSNMYGYKIDIHNYFNAIDTNILLNNLEKILDEDIYLLIKSILDNDEVLFNEKVIYESKGAMAGIPLAVFFANFYIKEIDEYFQEEKVFYLRYADDIILFANTKEQLDFYVQTLKDFIKKYKLELNYDKEKYFNPLDKLEFLGFEFDNNSINLTDHAVLKIKGKIKRKARAIRRWKLKNNISDEAALKTIIKKFNNKFYGNDTNELSWKYWFFPELTKTDKLNIIDNYMQEELRFIITGVHNKKNLEYVPYSMLKDCGYKSLVHEYYKFHEQEKKAL